MEGRADRRLDLWEEARLLALLNVAMADGFIAAFEAKYHYAYWRPATAIREAGEPAWLSYLDTPPVPDHPSAHAVVGAAAAAVLARCLGSDYVSFSATSGDPYPGLVRRFWSFSDAARENGASRVLAGIHFPTAVRAGLTQGDEVGAHRRPVETIVGRSPSACSSALVAFRGATPTAEARPSRSSRTRGPR